MTSQRRQPPVPDAGFAPLLSDQLVDERARKDSLEQRGIAVISSAGTLVAIILGFLSLTRLGDATRMPPAALGLLVGALVSLSVASAMGLSINLPRHLPVVEVGELVQQSEAAITHTELAFQCALLTALRNQNRTRAQVLFWALLLEVLALVMLASSALRTLWPAL
ncbi:hypothetical protein [Streptomyces sp. NPDC051218]|uniref:hypothetical protein n=1 Tax=Streptomyces sp. NPDC051218 TaxID=3365645 RepID=UPI0037B74C9E